MEIKCIPSTGCLALIFFFFHFNNNMLKILCEITLDTGELICGILILRVHVNEIKQKCLCQCLFTLSFLTLSAKKQGVVIYACGVGTLMKTRSEAEETAQSIKLCLVSMRPQNSSLEPMRRGRCGSTGCDFKK